MCTKGTCMKYLGGWVQFRTPWGYHRGVIESVNDRAVLMRVPRQYAPVAWASHSAGGGHLSDQERLDIALAGWGYPGYAGWGYGYPRWGYPGWGGWWAGWWWWWLAFAWIFWLAFLWW